MAMRIQIRQDLAVNWINANPILAQGELGLELDTNKLKIGNGASTWTSLPYFSAFDNSIFGTIVALEDIDDILLIDNSTGETVRTSLLTLKTFFNYHLHGNKIELDKITNGSHDAIIGNPHGTTASQVGAEPANSNIQNHIASTSNPHGTTASQVGAEPANANIQSHIASTSNPHSVTKTQIGLSNVDNTSDANKPISTATQIALNNKLETSLKGSPNGLAELGSDGKVPATQLPGFVDEVVEYANLASLPAIGTTGIIYVTLNDNKIYRWSGSAYIIISDSIALGETSSTAYRGDRGKIAYDHSQITTGNPHGTTASQVGAEPANANIQNHIASTSNPHGTTASQVGAEPANANIQSHIASTSNPHNVTKTQVGLSNVDNTSDVNKPISLATQLALDLKLDTILKGIPNGLAELNSSGKVPESQLIFGNNFQYDYQAAETATTSTTVNQIKNSINTPIIPAGTYRIDYSILWRSGSSNRNIRHCIIIDGTEYNVSGQATTSNNASVIVPLCGFIYIDFTNDTHTIQQAFRVGALSGATIYAKEARLSIHRVS